MRVTPRLALVASGASGMGLTSPWDCNVYLVDGGGESALIDAGCGLEPERILDRISQSGCDAEAINYVLLTHCHADHSGGAAFWSERLGADVVAPGLCAAALREGDEDTTSLGRARAAGGYPEDYVLNPVPVARSVDEGDVIQVGEARLEVLRTPGHSFDHVSYLLRGEEGPLLFSGDVLLTDGRIMLLDTPDCRVHDYGETIRRLAGLRIEGLMPGHGAFTLTGAREIFVKAASYFERLVLPPKLLVSEVTDGMVVPLRDLELEDLPSGRVCELWLGLSVGLASMLVLPALVARGERSGPTSVISAGVHGDEFEGIVAVPEFVRSLDPGTLAGTVVGLPVCNPLAFEAQSRESPLATDGKNLAREFPGSSSGSATERLADELLRFVRRALGPEDLFIDLHSGGTRYRYLNMVGYRDVESPSREASEEAARHFGVGRLWSMDDEPGTFNSETARLGVPTVGTETTGQGGCRQEDVAAYTRGLRNLLRHRGMIPGEPPLRDDGPAWRPTPVDATTNGLLRASVDIGGQVASGEVMGEVVSPFEETLERLRAPHDGEVWAVRAFGSVRAGDMAAWVARPSA